MCRLTFFCEQLLFSCTKRKRKEEEEEEERTYFPSFLYVIFFLHRLFNRKKLSNEIWHLFLFLLRLIFVNIKKRNELW